MKSTIICISGWKRSGKDTAANLLIEKYGAKRIGFADPLKDLVSELFPVERMATDSPVLKEAPLYHMPVKAKDGFSKNVTEFMSGELKHGYWTPRALCILVGSTMRSVDSDFWVKKALAKVEPGGLYVIADARYKNEIDTIKSLSPSVLSLRINRFDESPSTDPSERDLDDYKFDHTIYNKGTLEDFLESVDNFMQLQRNRF